MSHFCAIKSARGFTFWNRRAILLFRTKNWFSFWSYLRALLLFGQFSIFGHPYAATFWPRSAGVNRLRPVFFGQILTAICSNFYFFVRFWPRLRRGFTFSAQSAEKVIFLITFGGESRTILLFGAIFGSFWAVLVASYFLGDFKIKDFEIVSKMSKIGHFWPLNLRPVLSFYDFLMG